MVILELILAHLLGDFVFQSNHLILKKYKSWIGTFQHVLIIATLTALLLFPYWGHKETWIAIGVIFVAHFVQDILKIEFDLRFNQTAKSTLPFFADQGLHLLLIAYLSSHFASLDPMALPTWVTNLYFSKELIIYLLGLILFSYAYDITLYQFQRQKSKKALDFKPDHRQIAQRLLLFSVAYVLVLVLSGSIM